MNALIANARFHFHERLFETNHGNQFSINRKNNV